MLLLPERKALLELGAALVEVGYTLKTPHLKICPVYVMRWWRTDT